MGLRLIGARLPPTRRAGRSFGFLVAAVLLLGIADSMAGSFMVLFAANRAGLSPIQVGVFVSAASVGGIVTGFVVGRRFDRRPTRAYAVALTAAGALGFALLSGTTSFPLLIVLALTLLGASTAAFPQLFSLARVLLGTGRAGQHSAPLLRSGWSLAWAIGPLVGAALLARTSFTGLFWAVAAVLAVTAIVILATPSAHLRQSATADPVQVSPSSPLPAAVLGLLTISITLFFGAMIAGSVALPLYVTRALHQPDTVVGVLYSACAAVEILAALALVWLPARISQRSLILGAMLVLVLYFAVTVLAGGLGLLLVGQAARGVAIGVVGAAGIRYFQDVLTPATGRATTLFFNAGTAGSLLAGVLAGASVQSFGSTTTLLLCGAAALAGALAFYLATLARFIPADAQGQRWMHNQPTG